MRRRTFLAAAAGATAASAGCAQLSDTVDRVTEGSSIDDLGGGDHPWGGDAIVVAVAYEDGLRRENFPDLIEQSTAFWENNAGEYVGYEVEYDLRPDAEDPDVEVSLVSAITSCQRHGDDYQVVGCAPLIEGNAPDTARVEIKSGYSDGLTQTTITHELGHTLGLGHDDEPVEIMSGDPADRLPNYETRRAIHEAYLAGMQSTQDGNDEWGAATGDWNDENWTAADEGFATAADEYDDAVSSFEAARSKAAELELGPAVDICEDARLKADAYRAAAEAMSRAAAAQADGDRERAKERYDEAEGHQTDADDYRIRGSDALAVELGLK